jgi:predicted amidohydrolase
MNKKKLVKIAAIQTKVSGDINSNLRKTERMIRQAAKKGAQIICLQELFNIPYIPQRQGVNKDKYSERVGGVTTSLMKKLAKELGVVIIVPFFEKSTNGKYYNTALVFDEKGKQLGLYHKVHIPHDPGFYEKDYFEHGQEGYKVFKTKYGSFAVLICYDQWFPEAAREARLAGAEIIFYPTAIADIIGYKHPNDWHDAWETSMRGHAIANSVAVVAVNRVGVEGRSRFWGQSFVSDPWGKILKRASKEKEEVLVQELDLAYNEFLSEGWGFLRNRRPDTYKTLLSNKLVIKSKKLQNVEHYKAEQKALGEK